jgi:hypothetical protein
VKGSGVWAVYDEIIFTDGSALFFKSNGATTAEATKDASREPQSSSVEREI